MNTGTLRKMQVELADPVQYYFLIDDKKILLNPLLGQKISLQYTGEILCIHCGRKTQKSFQGGYCFPCYRKFLECNLCIIHPERCRYYEGNCKPEDWGHAHCGQKHFIYLANSSALKVGITRATHIPTRWIDQGATQGLVIFEVQNRYQAGLVEVALKKYVSDKTNWQVMLKGDNEKLDLLEKRDEILVAAKEDMEEIFKKFPNEIIPVSNQNVIQLNYPVNQYLKKITSFNFDKGPLVEGILLGIKGQYLILDTGVISVRKFGGYHVKWDVK